MNLLRWLRSDPHWKLLQSDRKRQIAKLLDTLDIEANITISDLALNEPEKIITLGQQLAKLERDREKPGIERIVPEGIPTAAVAIAWELSGLTQPIFAGEISQIVAPWNDQQLVISRSTLERLISEYRDSRLSDEDMIKAQTMADKIIKRIQALPNSLI